MFFAPAVKLVAVLSAQVLRILPRSRRTGKDSLSIFFFTFPEICDRGYHVIVYASVRNVVYFIWGNGVAS